MSHINEALRKAQKEKDVQYLSYPGVLSARKRRRRGLGRRLLGWGALLLILVLLSFTAYSWWASRDRQASARTGQGPRALPAPRGRAGGVRAQVPKRTPPTKAESRNRVPRPRESPAAEALYERGRRFQRMGRWQDAKRHYQEALKMDPGHVNALNNLGVLYIRERNYATAQKTFEKAMRLRPKHVDPHYNLACLHAIKGEVEQSLLHLKEALALNRAVREWARKDTDLQNLRGLPEFEEIIK